MKINIDELREALGEKKPDEKIEIEREKLKIARERLELERRKQEERERQNRAREGAKGRASDEGKQWVISLSITAFILLISLAFAVWVLVRF